jgi:GNAT superfamily N-acetyltransferase
MSPSRDIRIVPATERDVPTIHKLIGELAAAVRLEHQMEATEEDVREALFGEWPAAEAVLAYVGADLAGYALFYHAFSTLLGRRGLYLEDVFVLPAFRQRGVGRRLLSYVARIAVERRCGRLEWSVLDWNESAIRFYRSLGAVPMDDATVYRLAGDALARAADL